MAEMATPVRSVKRSTSTTSTSPSTRNQTNIWLIGQPEQKLPENVLPTTSDVLKTIFFHHTVQKKTIPESLKLTAHELMDIWGRARVPTAFQPNIISKMRSLVDDYTLLKKSKGRASEVQKAKENNFIIKTTDLFDIAHKEAETLIKIEEDKVFLIDQREGRKMKMAGVDKDLFLREDRTRDRKKAEEERFRREEERRAAANTSFGVACASSGEDDCEEKDDIDGEDFEIEIPIYYRKQITATKLDSEASVSNPEKKSRILENMLKSPDVSSTLDRINLSDTKFTMLAAAIVRANGEDLDDNTLSRSTVYRRRAAHRSSVNNTVWEEFRESENSPLVVHWDGKLMKDRTNAEDPKANVDRLPVVVTGSNVEKILGIAKLSSGTGDAQAKATFQLLVLWNVVDDVIAMSFDTTASNTGVMKGACVLLEKLIGKNLLHLACRHHILELIVCAVFTTLFGPSKGPKIPLFQRFQDVWHKIDHKNYKPLEDPQLELLQVKKLQQDVTTLLQNVLSRNKGYIPREDYKEIMELCLLVLGKGKEDYHFRIPGAYHMARWMAKVIYCFKIYLFRAEFKLTSREEKNLKEFCLFASLIYVRAWTTCTKARDAAVNDLALYKDLKAYETVNKTVSTTALDKLESHLWYLGPELVGLSLFSSKVIIEEKRLLVEGLRSCRDTEKQWDARGIKLKECEGLEGKGLHDLVSPLTIYALRSLGVDTDFLLNNDPETWYDSPIFQKGRAIIDGLKVVNDAAERSVALMHSFNESITKSECEMQKLIQVVEDHRKRVPNAKKDTLKTYKPR